MHIVGSVGREGRGDAGALQREPATEAADGSQQNGHRTRVARCSDGRHRAEGRADPPAEEAARGRHSADTRRLHAAAGPAATTRGEYASLTQLVHY